MLQIIYLFFAMSLSEPPRFCSIWQRPLFWILISVPACVICV